MKAFLLILSMGWWLQSFSQQEYFVFLQTENRQPFYVRMGEKNFSSSANGYLILSKLKDSSYSFAVGFPQNQFPEQPFLIHVKKDRGFEVKNLGDKGWALFDLQTLELINSSRPAGSGSGGASYSLIKKDDGFARLMAGVVNDTAVMYTVMYMVVKTEPVVSNTAKDTVAREIVKEEKKPADTMAAVVTKPADTVTATVKKPEEPKKEDSVIAKHEEVKKPDTVAITTKIFEKDPMKDSVLNPPALPVIHVVNQFKTDSGYHMIFVDDARDSIDIFIPADAPQQHVEKPATDTVKAEIKIEKKTVDSSTIIQPKTDTAAIKPPVKETIIDTPKTSSRLVMINSDCRSFATANDVDKLRVKLISEKDSEARIAAAKKIFKTKCFSALQIKALSEMFPYDEQKYRFFETAYPFVSDTSNFKSLVSLFSDPVYVQRFRKLVRLD
jgi:hypothetical protein